MDRFIVLWLFGKVIVLRELFNENFFNVIKENSGESGSIYLFIFIV